MAFRGTEPLVALDLDGLVVGGGRASRAGHDTATKSRGLGYGPELGLGGVGGSDGVVGEGCEAAVGGKEKALPSE